MEAAPLPQDEADRLAVLEAYRILDTPAEATFDDLTRFASRLCGTPIALVSLVAAHRQWFKSRVGLDAPETPRELAFCAHAILQDEVFEVPDAAADRRFADNPLVLGDPRIRFYAGAPLIGEGGHALGTLCVIDQVPRQLDDLQRDGLAVLGRQVVAQLDLRRSMQELASARDAALAAARAKDIFLGHLGHELRTPMNTILGYAQLMMEESTSTGHTSVLPDLAVIERAGQHAAAVIEDILELAQIEAGVPRLRVEEVRLDAFVADIQAFVRPQLRGRGLVWSVAHEPDLGVIRTDPTKLRQILLNLLGNAIKFTPAGEVRLRVRRGGHGVLFEVADTGIGIPPDKISLLFRDFTQVHTSAASLGGAGLGLAISQRHARLLGGVITVESTPGRGSRFALSIPLQAPA